MQHMFSKNLISLALSFCICGSLLAMEASGKKPKASTPRENPLTLSQELPGSMSMDKSLDQLINDFQKKMNIIDDISTGGYINYLVTAPPLCIGRDALSKIKSNPSLDSKTRLALEQEVNTGILDAIGQAKEILNTYQKQIASLDPKLPETKCYWRTSRYRDTTLKNAEKYMCYINYVFLEAKNLNIQITDNVLDESYALSNNLFSYYLEYINSISSFLNNRIAHLNVTQMFASYFKEAATRVEKEPIKIHTEEFKTIRELISTLSKTAEQYSLALVTNSKKTTK